MGLKIRFFKKCLICYFVSHLGAKYFSDAPLYSSSFMTRHCDCVIELLTFTTVDQTFTKANTCII